MNHLRSVRRTFVTAVLTTAVLMNAVLPALLVGTFSPVRVGFAPTTPVLAGDDTKTGGGSG